MVNTETHTAAIEDRQNRSPLEAGQALVEYGLILAFVSVTAVTVTPIGAGVAARFAEIAAAV
jgi:Flp pilus assembly pilin Flp